MPGSPLSYTSDALSPTHAEMIALRPVGVITSSPRTNFLSFESLNVAFLKPQELGLGCLVVFFPPSAIL